MPRLCCNSACKRGIRQACPGVSPKVKTAAWRITGDYGTREIVVCFSPSHICWQTTDEAFRLPYDARSIIARSNQTAESAACLGNWFTHPLGECLLVAVAKAIEEHSRRGRLPQIVEKIRELCGKKTSERRSEARFIDLLSDAARYVHDSRKADGLLIILDELGKFLEFAAVHPDRQDIYFLQMLAEAASRSGDAPILVVGLLHQGFHAYAEQLTLVAQKEWEKVAGRYEEILFDQPLEQTTSLVAGALNVRRDQLPRGTVSRLERDMGRAVDLGWFGASAARQRLVSTAAQLYPLHPIVIQVFVRLFSRFGQNERSLYSFLLSNEPHALQSFSEQRPRPDSLYCLHHLYDYARAAFGHRLTLQSFRSHWNQIESVVDSFPRAQEHDLRILKTVAILNLLDTPSLLASDDVISLAVGDFSTELSLKSKALKELHRGKSVLYYRGASGGYCLWPHTSVNLDRTYHDAIKAVPVPIRVSPLIRAKVGDPAACCPQALHRNRKPSALPGSVCSSRRSR